MSVNLSKTFRTWLIPCAILCLSLAGLPVHGASELLVHWTVPLLTENQAMAAVQPNLANGTAVMRYAVTTGQLPPGLALDPATGVITGTPTRVGATDVTLTATTSDGRRASAEVNFCVIYRL